jgi:hypothetical protein
MWTARNECHSRFSYFYAKNEQKMNEQKVNLLLGTGSAECECEYQNIFWIMFWSISHAPGPHMTFSRVLCRWYHSKSDHVSVAQKLCFRSWRSQTSFVWLNKENWYFFLKSSRCRSGIDRTINALLKVHKSESNFQFKERKRSSSKYHLQSEHKN